MNDVTLSISELKQLLQDAAELGAANYAKNQSLKNDMVSQRAAYTEFGEG
ncbi:MAG: hypothetical protein AB7V25_00370 [Mangrovibacterium sp.]